MGRLKNRIHKIGLNENEIRENRINIIQSLINNIEENQTPFKTKLYNNLINDRLLFSSKNQFLVNPTNKKKLSRQRPIEYKYTDQKENFTKQYLSKKHDNSKFGDYGSGIKYPYLYPFEYINKLDLKPLMTEKFYIFDNQNKTNIIYIIIIIIIIYYINKYRWNQ